MKKIKKPLKTLNKKRIVDKLTKLFKLNEQILQ